MSATASSIVNLQIQSHNRHEPAVASPSTFPSQTSLYFNSGDVIWKKGNVHISIRLFTKANKCGQLWFLEMMIIWEYLFFMIRKRCHWNHKYGIHIHIVVHLSINMRHHRSLGKLLIILWPFPSDKIRQKGEFVVYACWNRWPLDKNGNMYLVPITAWCQWIFQDLPIFYCTGPWW